MAFSQLAKLFVKARFMWSKLVFQWSHGTRQVAFSQLAKLFVLARLPVCRIARHGSFHVRKNY